MSKETLRKQMKSILATLSEAERAEQSAKVACKLFTHWQFERSQRVSIYVSRQLEVNTSAIIEHILAQGKFCFIPKYDPNSRYMTMVRLHSLEELDSLPLTKWNIRQHVDHQQHLEDAMQTGGLDLIITPGLAFTKLGHRLGLGRGYYDSFIQQIQQKSSQSKLPYILGLAFNQQIVPFIQNEPHDVMVNEVITPD